MRKLLLMLTLCAFVGYTFAQINPSTSNALLNSCKDDANELVKIVWSSDGPQCPGESNLAGLPELAWESGANNFSAAVSWNASGALRFSNVDCNTYQVVVSPLDYYGVEYDSVDNIQMVMTDPDDPFSIINSNVARDTIPGGFGCQDLIVYLADLPTCPDACAPDTITYTEAGIWPDTIEGFAETTVDECTYEQLITVVVRDDTLIFVPGIGTLLFDIVNFTVDSVGGLPPGYTYECEPGDCVFPALSENCAVLKGNPEVAGEGVYPLTVYVTANLYNLFTDTIASPAPVTGYELVIGESTVCDNSVPPQNPVHTLLGSGAYKLDWDPVPNSVGCQVSLDLPTGGNVKKVVNTPEASTFTVPAGPIAGFTGQDIIWRVRCACSLGPVVATAFSAPDTFTVGSPKLAADIALSDVNLYPNPADNEINLNYQAWSAGNLEISVINMLGQIVEVRNQSTSVGINSLRLNVSDLNPGMYLMRLSDGQGEMVKSFTIGN